jgi:hypothetical protein
MAIEIKELSINVKVNSDSVSDGHRFDNSADSQIKIESIVEECVQRVLEELSHRKEGR